MNIKVIKKIGNNTIEFTSDEPDFKKAMTEIVPFTQSDKCTLCKNTDITLETNKANANSGTFIYIKRKCSKCGAQSTLGEYKGGGYFWKEWFIYKTEENK